MVDAVPGAIITDESPAIKSAISELQRDRKFTGVHLLDNFHLIRNIKKKLVEKDKIKYFIQLLQAQSMAMYNQLVREFEHHFNIEKDIKTYRTFLEKS